MEGAKILIIENKPDYARTVKEFLELEGFHVALADNETDGRRLLEQGGVDLAILDIRLRNDDDEYDDSGLQLAKDTAPGIPKIILTKYPTTDLVREALAPTSKGKPPAVGFVAKQEPLEDLLRTIRLALMRIDPVIEDRLLGAFEVQATVNLNESIKKVGPDNTIERLQRIFDEATDEYAELREQESKRASQLHVAGMIASGLGILFILVSGALLLSGSVPGSIVSLSVSVVTNAIKVLFSKREDEAHRRVRGHLQDLAKVTKLGNYMAIVETLETPLDRDLYKKKMLDYLANSKTCSRTRAKG